MASKKEAFGDLGLLILRIGAGLQLAFLHGLDKLRHFSERAPTWLDPLNLGHKRSLQFTVGAEFFCALLLVLGLLSRVAGLAIAFTMGVATFMIHKGEPWRQREDAVLYLCVGLGLVLLGPGGISLDRVIVRRLKKISFRRGSSGAPAGE